MRVSAIRLAPLILLMILLILTLLTLAVVVFFHLWNDIKSSICLFPLAVLRLNMLYDKLIDYDTKALRINFYFCKIFKLL